MIVDEPSGTRLAQLWEHLESRWPENLIEPTLARIAAVTSLLGDPQRAYPVIHVTGTNGKSSTARMVESLLRGFGLRTGLFTSPTAVRLLMRYGEQHALKHDLSSLERVFCAGEVLNAPAWEWLQKTVLKDRIPPRKIVSYRLEAKA